MCRMCAPTYASMFVYVRLDTGMQGTDAEITGQSNMVVLPAGFRQPILVV